MEFTHLSSPIYKTLKNIMLSIDYPFSTNQMGIDFLNDIKLPINSFEKDMLDICVGETESMYQMFLKSPEEAMMSVNGG